MPIRFVDRTEVTRVGAIISQLDNASGSLAGTHTAPPARTGTVAASLQPVTGSLTGSFQSNANRTGTIATTLSGATASFAGAFTAAGTSFGAIRTFNTSPTAGDVDRAKIARTTDVNAAAGAMQTWGAAGSVAGIEWYMQPLSGNNAASVSTGAGLYTAITGNAVIDCDRYNLNPAFDITLTDGRLTISVRTNSGSYTARGTSDLRLWTSLLHCAVQLNTSTGNLQAWLNGAREINVTHSSMASSIAYPAGATPLNLCGLSGNQPCTFSDPYVCIGQEKHLAGDAYPGCSMYFSELHFYTGAKYSSSATITPPSARLTAVSGSVTTRGLWHCDESSGTQLTDASGNGNHGQLFVGGPNSGPTRVTNSPSFTGGTLAHGSLYTISVPGGGLGTRPDYNTGNYTWMGHRHIHFRFTDFAGGQPATNTDAAWLAQTKGFIPSVAYSDMAGRGFSFQSGGPSRSGYFFRRQLGSDGDRRGGMMTSVAGIHTGFDIYVSMKILLRGFQADSVSKFWRMYIQGDGNLTLNPTRIEREIVDTGFTGGYWGFNATNWGRFEIVALQNPGSRFYWNGSILTASLSTANPPNRTLLTGWVRPADRTDGDDNMYFPNMLDEVPGSLPNDFNYTDIYADWTAARVEITGANGKVETQPVVSWANTAIQIAVNLGEMSAGAATVRVYNSANSVIHTQSVTLPS